MMYMYIDGDNIGLKIEKSFMDNDEESLKSVNNDIKKITNDISQYLKSLGFQIIFSGADGIICKCLHADLVDISYYIKKVCAPYTFSIGAGTSLRNSFLALRYAKSMNKNTTSLFDGKTFSMPLEDPKQNNCSQATAKRSASEHTLT